MLHGQEVKVMKQQPGLGAYAIDQEIDRVYTTATVVGHAFGGGATTPHTSASYPNLAHAVFLAMQCN